MKIKNLKQSINTEEHFRDLEKKPNARNSQKPAQPRRPNPMAYRAVSRPPVPGGGK
jgi:hypothetical protein